MRIRSRRPRDESGMTLAEVLAAGAVLSIVVLCLANAWTVFDRVSFGLLLRQKAVFVLNGEVERLSSLYGTTSFGANGWTGTNGYTLLANRAGSDSNHRVYATNSTGVTFVTSSTSTFLNPSTADTEVLATGTGTAAQNWVWLDYTRGLVARLSWMECQVPYTPTLPALPVLPTACWQQQVASPVLQGAGTGCYKYDGSGNAGSCLLITAVLEYPFQVQGARSSGSGTAVPALGTVPNTAISGSLNAAGTPMPAKVLTLSTIVGRRE